MTDEEYKYKIVWCGIRDEMKHIRARCSQVCPCYNSEDRDCEIFGGQKIPPSRCDYFLKREVQRRMREKED